MYLPVTVNGTSAGPQTKDDLEKMGVLIEKITEQGPRFKVCIDEA